MSEEKMEWQLIKPTRDRSSYDKYIEDAELPVKIDKDIPMPGQKKPFIWVKLATKMEVGDSVLFDNEDKVRVLRQAGYQKGIKFKQRRVDESIRVWRVL